MLPGNSTTELYTQPLHSLVSSNSLATLDLRLQSETPSPVCGYEAESSPIQSPPGDAIRCWGQSMYKYALGSDLLTVLLGFTLTLHVVRGYEESGEWTV